MVYLVVLHSPYTILEALQGVYRDILAGYSDLGIPQLIALHSPYTNSQLTQSQLRASRILGFTV